MVDSPFCEVNLVVDADGSNLLLASFKIFGASNGALEPEPQIHLVDLLLSGGSHIDCVNTAGENLLHVVFNKINSLHGSGNWVKILAYIVSRGANIHATDASGRSVTRAAYHSGICPLCEGNFGSFTGDLWDAVLVASGVDIYPFRQDSPRRASYTQDYSREHFERLWEGKEHLCPYWDDASWPEVQSPSGFDRWDRLQGEFCPSTG
jgi:hypothetical protein